MQLVQIVLEEAGERRDLWGKKRGGVRVWGGGWMK